jgi:hypothetical protein
VGHGEMVHKIRRTFHGSMKAGTQASCLWKPESCPGFQWLLSDSWKLSCQPGIDHSFEALPVIVAPGVVAMKRNSRKE